MENKPTCIVDKSGIKFWYLDGKLHNEDGPAVEYSDGAKYWYINNELHREDGPAVEGVNGTKEWYQHNKLHRLDGPAIEYADGKKGWYINDYGISSEIQPWATENDIDLNNLTDDDKNLIKIIWADHGK